MKWDDPEAVRRRELSPEQSKLEAEALAEAELAEQSGTLDLSNLAIAALPTAIRQMDWLTSLDCSNTQVSDLLPLPGLTALASLDCRNTPVSDLSPLAGLTALASLYCNSTPVSDLLPLAGLTALASLNCNSTPVSDLSPLPGLTALASLDCRNTPVSDLSPLAGLTALASLNCCNTQVSDLSPLRYLPSLSKLVASGLRDCPILSEHLSQDYGDNCLPRLHAYWDNLEGGGEPFRQHKLFPLGNGTVGKTQVALALIGEPYDDTIASTHGIQLLSQSLPAPADPRHAEAGEAFTANIWDFGGQDIYHGTHALFLKTRAIFLICWEGDSEKAREHTIDGTAYRNRPLAYWRDYVQQFAGPNAEVILVQTKNDKPGSAADAAVMEAVYPETPACSTSARDGEGFNRLKRLIAEAVSRIEAPALPIIPSSYRRVIDAVTAARKTGTRTMDREAFAALCRDCGLIGAPENMLHFLHHTGEVFQAEGRFGDQVIVNQRWALDAIYAVFDREHCWQKIKAERGRFTLALLAETAWQAFSPADHRHLLAMMLQCGMAFEYLEGEKGEREAIYIAPDLLPDFDDKMVQRWYLREWDLEGAIQSCTIPITLLHDGLIRALMVAIGKDAGMWAVYWKNGVLFHDMNTRALATVEARWPDPEGWAGEIVITTQRSRARELLTVLERHVRDVAERLGVSLGQSETLGLEVGGEYIIVEGPTRALRPNSRHSQRRAQTSSANFAPGRGSPRVPSCYVSYAWGDGTEQADANERMVDDLCAAASARGIEIIRDKTHLASGDSINGFTEEIARAERVAALIGGRYWTRPDCFAELHGCWTEARQRPDVFREKIREFIFPDGGLYNAGLVQTIAQHWEPEFARCDGIPGTYRDRHAALIADHADSWVPQCRRIVSALQDKVRTYEADFEAFKHELFAELEALRYKPDHDPDA
jgi:internalin A